MNGFTESLRSVGFRWFLAALLVFVVTVGVSRTYVVIAQKAPAPPAPSVGEALGPGRGTVPDLTADEVDAAASILARDERFQVLARGRAYEITEALSWVRASEKERSLVGVVFTIKLSEAIRGEFEWIGIAFDDLEGVRYRSVPARAGEVETQMLQVRVDLAVKSVVEMIPGEGARLLKPFAGSPVPSSSASPPADRLATPAATNGPGSSR